jgi:hypothetical protein
MTVLPTDYRLISCSLGARYLMRILADLAVNGRCTCTPKQLKAVVFGGLDDITEAHIEQFLGELASRFLIDPLSDNDIKIIDWEPVEELLTEATRPMGSA